MVKPDGAKQMLHWADMQGLENQPHCPQSKWMLPICQNGMVETHILDLEMAQISSSLETLTEWMLTDHQP